MFFSLKNSVIVPYDYTNSDSLQDLEDQIIALKEHYQFITLSEMIARVKKGKSRGFAAIVFDKPRKGVFVKAVPILLSLNVPFFLFIDPDYTGLNRLPMSEELCLYRDHYSNLFTQSEFEQWVIRSRREPEETDFFLKDCRKKFGPLPIEKIDPLSFFSTWGKILELPPDSVDFGITLSHQIISPDTFQEKLSFVGQHLKKVPDVVRAPTQGFSREEIEVLKQCGVEGVLGHQVAPIDKNANVFDLPIWRLN